MEENKFSNQASMAMQLAPGSRWGEPNQVIIEQFTEVDFSVSKVRYSTHSLFFSFTGIVELQTDGILDRHLLPMQGILHAANEIHSAKSLKPTSFLALHICPTYLTSLIENPNDATPLAFRTQIIEDDDVSAILCAVDKEMSSEDLHTDLALQSLVVYICVHLVRKYSELQPFGESNIGRAELCHIKEALEYIEMFLMNEIQIPELAAQAQMSVYRFLTTFKELTGQTPHQYIIRRRLEVAKHLLRKPGLSLEEIALSTGFANQSHFTKMFRKHIGSTPNVFRKL